MKARAKKLSLGLQTGTYTPLRTATAGFVILEKSLARQRQAASAIPCCESSMSFGSTLEAPTLEPGAPFNDRGKRVMVRG
jgi:hypothetical protein